MEYIDYLVSNDRLPDLHEMDQNDFDGLPQEFLEM